MKFKNLPTLLAILLGAISVKNSHANDWSFSLASGAPYFLNPELSLMSETGDTRFYGNVKMALVNGGSIGFESSISSNKKHALGAFIGSIGVKIGDHACNESDAETFENGVGEVIACTASILFDWERVDGIGFSYSYNFSGLSESSGFIRFEAGYGVGSQSDKELSSGGVLVGYRF